MRKTLILVGVLLVAAGCAKKPEEISAVDIGSGAYRGQSCSQLAAALVQQQQNLENLSAAQRSAASGDAMGVFLLGLPLSSMSGNDKEAAIAVSKGHVQSIQSEQQRRCMR